MIMTLPGLIRSKVMGWDPVVELIVVDTADHTALAFVAKMASVTLATHS